MDGERQEPRVPKRPPLPVSEVLTTAGSPRLLLAPGSLILLTHSRNVLRSSYASSTVEETPAPAKAESQLHHFFLSHRTEINHFPSALNLDLSFSKMPLFKHVYWELRRNPGSVSPQLRGWAHTPSS